MTPDPVSSPTSAAQREAAKDVAKRLLRTTDRSRAALIQRLIERDVAPDIAEAAVDDLERVGLVDDARLAEQLIASALARGPVGRDRLAAKLEGTIAAAALDAAFADRDPAADADAAARVHLRTLPPRLDTAARARRLAAALARRGFDADTVDTAVRTVLPEFSDADDADT